MSNVVFCSSFIQEKRLVALEKLYDTVTYGEDDGGVEFGHVVGSGSGIDFVENSVDNAGIGPS